MYNTVEINFETHDSSTEAIELNKNQEFEMDKQGPYLRSTEVNHQSVKAQKTLVTEPIIKQIERM